MTEEQKEILITCCKCHGAGKYRVLNLDSLDGEDYAERWYERKCELCKGTGKISLAFYEDLQRSVPKR